GNSAAFWARWPVVLLPNKTNMISKFCLPPFVAPIEVHKSNKCKATMIYVTSDAEDVNKDFFQDNAENMEDIEAAEDTELAFVETKVIVAAKTGQRETKSN
ncbi:hypothetical protein HDU79_003257, partial [Rhizoclosmatium sp. JEL0117]